ALTAEMYVPAEQVNFDCEVINLSPGGAGILCAEPPPLKTFIVLNIAGFGQFEGVTTRYVPGELGMSFACSTAKVRRLIRDLTGFIERGITSGAHLRKDIRSHAITFGHFTRANGEKVSRAIVNFSLTGASLRTASRPPLGEIINLGHTRGRVIRHDDVGIAVEFLPPEHLADDTGNAR
ncbi:MAG: hypothetical protein ABI608_05600, partial [Rhizomicrobium sp.]